MYSYKKASSTISHCSLASSRGSSRALSKACKLYLNKYQEVKADIGIKAQLLKGLKAKRTKLQEKSRALDNNKENRQYKAEMISNKEDLEEFLQVYKQHYSIELDLLKEKLDIENDLRNLQIEHGKVQETKLDLQKQLKQNREVGKYALQCKKYDESISEIRLQLLELELKISHQCSTKKLKNLRYHICQFSKENRMSSIQDLTICQEKRVNALELYLKNQPLFVTLRKEVEEFISLYRVLEKTLESKPQTSEWLSSMKTSEERLQTQLKHIQEKINQAKCKLEQNSRQLQQQANKQIQINIKALLDQNPTKISQEAKQVAIEYQKRVKKVKQRLHQMKYVTDWLSTNQGIESNQRQILHQKQNLDKNIHLEIQSLRNQIVVREELEECLDNMITDRLVPGEQECCRRNTLNSFSEPPCLETNECTKLDSVNPKERLTRASSTCQSMGITHSSLSRKSRLVSLNQTERRLPMTHGMNKKSVDQLIMSRITQKRYK